MSTTQTDKSLSAIAGDRSAENAEPLPAPRLQLRWRKPTKRELARDSVAHINKFRWTCEYEIVLPLQENDIRRSKKRTELKLRIGRTFMSTGQPLTVFDPPFRDGAHAHWDSKALGDIPVYVINPDGSAIKQPNREAQS